MSDVMTVKADTSASRDLVDAQAYRVDTHDGRIGAWLRCCRRRVPTAPVSC
jgi:hypothetical protein